MGGTPPVRYLPCVVPCKLYFPVEEIIPDPKDVVFYEVVMEGRKEYEDAYLVTGNIKHFPARSFVVTPKEMLDIIHNEYRIY